MHNKDKRQKKYLDQKRFLINKVFHEIFKSRRNVIKKTPTETRTDYFYHYFIQDQNDMTRTWKKSRIKDLLQPFQQCQTCKTSLTTEQKSLRTLMNSLLFSKKFDHSFYIRMLIVQREKTQRAEKWYPRLAITIVSTLECLSFKVRKLKGLKNDIFDHQSWEFFQSPSFRSTCPEVFYKKIVLNNFEKFTDLTLWTIDSGTRVFL